MENLRGESAALSKAPVGCTSVADSEQAWIPCKICAKPISTSSSHRCIQCNALVHPFCGDGMDEEGNIIVLLLSEIFIETSKRGILIFYKISSYRNCTNYMNNFT